MKPQTVISAFRKVQIEFVHSNAYSPSSKLLVQSMTEELIKRLKYADSKDTFHSGMVRFWQMYHTMLEREPDLIGEIMDSVFEELDIEIIEQLEVQL